MGEILLIAVVALLVLGPDRLPSAAKAIGKGIRDLRASTKDLQSTIEQDTQIGAAVRELKGALRGDPETLYKRATGEDFKAPIKEPGESAFPKAPETDAVATKSDDEGTPAANASKSEVVIADASVNSAAKGDAPTGDVSTDNAGGDVPAGDAELGALLDQAYANSSDPWGTEAVNPHEAEALAEAPAHDPDLPQIKQPSGAVARVDGNDSDESSHG